MVNNEQVKVNKEMLPDTKKIATTFLTRTMKKILWDEEVVNFNIVFEEQEAISFLETLLDDYKQNVYSGFQETVQGMLDVKREDKPTLTIKDYVTFFENLRIYSEKYVELYATITRAKYYDYSSDIIEDCLERIWLRMTPDDFREPERFLARQIQMASDTTFEEFNEEQLMGTLSVFEDNPITFKNDIAKTYDELDHEFKITIYDKEDFHRTELIQRPQYMLPVIRYGIYESEGRLICRIGSIQNNWAYINSEKLIKIIGRRKYKVNKDISEEAKKDVQPTSLMALAIFINCLHEKGITCIEAPSMYALDYQYHVKREEEAVRNFNNHWHEFKIRMNPERYAEEKENLQASLNQYDLVSKIKSENFIKTLLRVMEHYPNVTVESYPTELENYLRMNVPIVQDKEEISNSLLQELYTLTHNVNKKK